MSKKVYSDRKTKPEKIEQSKAKEIIGLIIYCIIVVAIMFCVIKFVGQRTIVIGRFHESDTRGWRKSDHG